MKPTRRILLPALLVGLLVVLWLHARPFSPANSFHLEARVTADQNGRARLYFDRGNGFVAYDAVAAFVQPGSQILRFPLPDAKYTAFRFWPLDRSGRVTMESLRVTAPDGQSVRGLAVGEGGVPTEIETMAGEGFDLRLEPALELSRGWKISWHRALSDFAIVAASTALLLVLGGLVPDGLRARLVRGLTGLRGGLERVPRLVLLLAAMVATTLSCSPVIFAGRSFVSPGNGALLLYDEVPTIPGAMLPPGEDPRGSDVGAVMWAHLPYSVIEHRAVFHDHEIPLWNRYNYGGVPLLGQGMSMLGDPLHWITIVNGGAAWAWDLKFLLAKTCFALGVGLCVRAATGRLWLAVLMALSSSFLGFFHYRFNHPAFFALCYAPWILHAWLGAAQAPGRVWPWALAVALANFWQFNTGVMKESTMLIVSLNFTGLLCLWFAPLERRGRRIGAMVWGCALFVLMSAPCWLSFLDALRHSWTPYDTPRAFQIQPSLALGLFDDLFYRPFTQWENHYNPSANFLVLLGVVWTVIHLRTLLSDRTLAALVIGALPSAALVFGLIPASLITRIPFLANVEHVDNTFSVVLIVHLVLIAGYGLSKLWDRSREPGFALDWCLAAAVLVLLAAVYFGTAQVTPREMAAPNLSMRVSQAFVGGSIVLALVVLALPLVARSLRQQANFAGLLLGALGLWLLHFRHGMWTETKFDYYVMNPQPRSDLASASPALESIRARIASRGEPARVAGHRLALVPGFQAVYGLEHFAGADALVNRQQRELCALLPTPPLWGWRWTLDSLEANPLALGLCNLWGVRWLVAMPCDAPDGTPNGDLTVKENPLAWPRAFFTDQLLVCNSLANFAELLPGSAPFAATTPLKPEERPPAQREALEKVNRSPARDYRLTSNSTAFRIDAPSAGVAVLSETFEPGNWVATLDGQAVDYFRVNHASMGVMIHVSGPHTIRFSYWPRWMNLALWLGATGAFLVLLTPMLARLCFGAPPAR